jgi:hypothetical protein
MKNRLLIVGSITLALVACRAAPEQQLKDSFVKQIVASGIAHDVTQNGDEVLFSARYGDQLDAKWRVHIDSASIDRKPDGSTPSKGLVKSSWYLNGEPIRPSGSESNLPLAFLDKGIAQECWAFWDDSNHQWSWE